MELVQTLVIAGIAFIGVGASALVGFFTGQRAAIEVQGRLRDEFESLRTSCANLSHEAQDYMVRAAASANRAQASAAGQKKRETAATPQMTEADYRVHLERGGQVIPEVERALGLI